MSDERAFFECLTDWQKVHGRHGLPWQATRDPYRVWLSEIMLQQTQVSTVLDYYPRFLQRFPDVQSLAMATQDEVLALWSGLGYYSRARNLHHCAQEVVERWGGRFPSTAQALSSLKGIGPSTAAAIAAFCFGERISILDGNVKRVLTRLLAFEGDLAQQANERVLWTHAQALLPAKAAPEDMVAYTQGLMDLGATVCTRSRPSCLVCPVAALCEARRLNRETDFPVKTRKLVRRTEAWYMLALRRGDGALRLEQRPSKGIWAGLYALPVFGAEDEALDAAKACGADTQRAVFHEPFAHDLTHRALILKVIEVPVASPEALADPVGGLWVSGPQDLAVGLPAPLRSWLVECFQ